MSFSIDPNFFYFMLALYGSVFFIVTCIQGPERGALWPLIIYARLRNEARRILK